MCVQRGGMIIAGRVLLLKIIVELVLEWGRFEHKKGGNMGRIVKGCYEKDKIGGEKVAQLYKQLRLYTSGVFKCLFIVHHELQKPNP